MKRYRLGEDCYMTEEENGNFVYFTHHAAALAAKDTENTGLRDDVRQAELAYEQAKEEIEDLRIKFKVQSDARDMYALDCAEKDRRIAELKDRNARAITCAADYAERETDLRAELATSNENIKWLELGRSELQIEVNSLHIELDRKCAELATARAKIATQRERFVEQESALLNLHSLIDRAEAEMTVLRTQAQRNADADYNALGVFQTRFQPAGSPPPGDGVMLARWIADSIDARLAEHRDAHEALAGLERLNGGCLSYSKSSEHWTTRHNGTHIADTPLAAVRAAEEAQVSE